MRIRVLGPVDLAGVTDPGGPKRLLLLGALALRPGRPRPVDALVDVLWGEAPPPEPHRALQVNVSKLRRALATAGVPATIEHGSGGYVLRCPAGTVDIGRFESLVDTGLGLVDGDPGAARASLGDALALWRGRPLGGLADDTALAVEVRALEDVHVRASAARAEACIAAGDPEAALVDVGRMVGEHPLHEPIRRLHVLALYRAGRQADALAAYEDARRVLAEELGVDPSPVLADLHLKVLRHDPALDPSAAGPPPPGAPDARTVAVLPFDVLGASADAVLLAAGLHNDLLVELSRLTALTVIARTSVAGYVDATRTARQVAAELGAGTVVLGTVQRSGARFRVSIQLVDAPRDVQRWAATFDDELTADNLFALQDDLARDIATSIGSQLDAPSATGPGPTADLDAYRLVAAGRVQFDLKTADGFASAVACFHEATRRDPSYAGAWVGLCDALVSMDAYGHGDRHELLPRAEEAVHRALAIAPDSAEARTSRAVLHVAYQRGTSALAELEHAMRIRPGYADAHSWHSWVALLTGDAAAGLASARRAAELDPRSAEVHAHLALGLAAVGSPAAAVHEARVAQRLSPYATAPLYEGLCLYELGRMRDAVDVLHPLVEHPGDGLDWTEGGPAALLSLALRGCGDPVAADAVAQTVEVNRHPFAAALVELGAGRGDRAMHALEPVDRLSAWPCLLVHHYLARVWDHAPAVRVRVRAVAARSW